MLFIPFLINVAYSNSDVSEDLNIKLYLNDTGLGSVTIDWSGYNCNERIFKVYRSEKDNNFESISIDYNQIKNINCLHVYPHEDLINQLSDWMKDYGQGIINVTSVFIDEFNKDPERYLEGCDVVLFGSYDYNNKKDLSEKVVTPLKNFIKSGKGVIFGHDTFWINDWPKTHDYFNQFAEDVGITVSRYTRRIPGEKVTIAKPGLLTTYPNHLETGKTFDVNSTHVSDQEVIDIDNVNFFLVTTDLQTRPNRSFYITTKNNVGLIQTGHSSGAATEDEKKIVANLIFYCNQLVSSNGYTVDYGAFDSEAPERPEVVGTYKEFALFSKDQGTKYSYYVESYSKSNTESGKYIAKSQTESIIVSTNVKSYIYVFDDKPNTVVTNGDVIMNDNNKAVITSNRIKGYLHVAAVDSANNISPTRTIKISNPYKTCGSKKITLSIKLIAVTLFVIESTV